jgi:hypothetical protein
LDIFIDFQILDHACQTLVAALLVNPSERMQQATGQIEVDSMVRRLMHRQNHHLAGTDFHVCTNCLDSMQKKMVLRGES